ncbi:MAG TPA: response regulator transcription factor [Gemmatimonadaceae bacterium]|jgi:two-component system KDP operon response regulator KdpE|nr:response regulator transcription factor [Gemmatimonadaceae bacterium]
MTNTVLIIEDEAQIHRAVRASLRNVTTNILEATTGQAGVNTVTTQHPDLIILDLGLPDIPGITVCQMIRTTSTAPILVLTARHDETEKVALLNAGADDYVTKPFGTSELAARVAAQLRRARTSKPWPESTLTIDGLVIDLTQRIVTRSGIKIRLTPTEWTLLRTLATDPGRVMTHQQIFEAVWQRQYGDFRQYLRVHITNLRRKIERDPAKPRIVITEPGVGYRFSVPS